MKRLLPLLAAVLFAAGCSIEAQSGESYVMNTICAQTVYGENARSVIAANNRLLSEIEGAMSRTMEGSDVYRVNHADGAVDVAPETLHVLSVAGEVERITGGAYNPRLGALAEAWNFGTGEERVPGGEAALALAERARGSAAAVDGTSVTLESALLDLGGCVKGYALDALRESMDEQNVRSALVSVGGSIYARGVKPDGRRWSVGIRDPLGGAVDYVSALTLEDECVSTSGAYERGFERDGVYYHHILDPMTGYPVQSGLLSVSIVDRNGLLTDLYSTALFVMGLEDGMALAVEQGIDAVFITEDRQIVTTPGFGRDFTIKDGAYHAG
jgi:thiamine biosynthesis lipoprotein